MEVGHHFTSEGASSQSYGLSGSHEWMWELDHKENWGRKDWCFWTVVLEKTLESPFDFKEIKPVNPEGDQSWIFIGRTDAEAEAPVLWPPDAKRWLTGKDPDAAKDWRQKEKQQQGWDGWMASPTWWTELEQLWGLVVDREACRAAVHGTAMSWTWLSNWTELNWTTAAAEVWFSEMLESVSTTSAGGKFPVCNNIWHHLWASWQPWCKGVQGDAPILQVKQLRFRESHPRLCWWRVAESYPDSSVPWSRALYTTPGSLQSVTQHNNVFRTVFEP